MPQDIIQINKSDLHELMVEFTKSKDNMTSNFMGDFKNDLREVKKDIGEIKENHKEIKKTIDTLVIAKAMDDGGKMMLKTVYGISMLLIIGLIGTIWVMLNEKIATKQDKVTLIQTK